MRALVFSCSFHTMYTCCSTLFWKSCKVFRLQITQHLPFTAASTLLIEVANRRAHAWLLAAS